mmetsp:Transcript_114758/g.256135  ORF Transcript_114758/g.256135 Transcript_114758/m.256135 type:complete len:324 (+) Transcript_114758:391-1362(+)
MICSWLRKRMPQKAEPTWQLQMPVQKRKARTTRWRRATTTRRLSSRGSTALLGSTVWMTMLRAVSRDEARAVVLVAALGARSEARVAARRARGVPGNMNGQIGRLRVPVAVARKVLKGKAELHGAEITIAPTIRTRLLKSADIVLADTMLAYRGVVATQKAAIVVDTALDTWVATVRPTTAGIRPTSMTATTLITMASTMLTTMTATMPTSMTATMQTTMTAIMLITMKAMMPIILTVTVLATKPAIVLAAITATALATTATITMAIEVLGMARRSFSEAPRTIHRQGTCRVTLGRSVESPTFGFSSGRMDGRKAWALRSTRQ